MNKTLDKILTILLIMSALASCDKQEQRARTVATVGESFHGEIDEKDFLYSYELTPSLTGNLRGLAAKKAHLEMLLNKKLLVLEGLARGLDKDEKVQIPLKWYEDKAVRQQLYREVARDRVDISDAELRDGFVRLNTTIRARHLPAKTYEDAVQLRQKLLAGASFEELATRSFKDTVLANNGGDLGDFTFGDFAEPFENAAFALNIGEISQPVKTKWAYHLIKVENKKKQAILTESEFQNKRRRIERVIRRRKESKLADRYIKDFMNPKKVRVYGPSITFLVKRAKELLPDDETKFPLEPPKLRDPEIGEIRQEVEDYLDEVIVVFDGGQWTIGDFLEKLRKVHPDARPNMRNRTNLKDVVSRMLRDEFFAQEGYRRGLQHSDYVKEEVRRWKEELVFSKLRKDLLDTVSVTPKEVKEFYAHNKSKYGVPARANIREIFVRDKKLAGALLERIKKGEDFAELAKKYSERKWAAKRGGEFGYFGLGMHGELGAKALVMRAGQLAGPVEIRDDLLGDGFSIFEVIAKKEKRVETFAEAKVKAERDLLAQKQSEVLTKFLEELKKIYEININEELLASIQTTDDAAKGRKVEMFAVPRQ